jgi:Outer membrane lipoprotein-sorting protein
MRNTRPSTLITLYMAMLLILPTFYNPAPVRCAPNARTLLQESEQRHRTRTQEYAGELTVVNKAGKVRRKRWKSYREGYAGNAKILIRFTGPPEVNGVGYLSLPRAGRQSDQWLYLPCMKRERRIASQERDTSFVGTDFNYEDMEEFDHTRYKVALQGEEAVDGQPCFVIEAIPKEQGDSIYKKKLLFLRQDILFLVRVDLYRKGDKTPEKRLILSNLQQIDGHWVAKTMVMSDLVKGSTTTVLLQDVALDRPQVADRFTLQNLNREGGD